MATVKHTPAPWTDGREGSGDFISPGVVVLGDTGECSKCGGSPGEIIIKPADKKLIKAAPDLADSLVKAEALIESARVLAIANGNTASEHAFTEALPSIRAAIRTAGRFE